MLKDVTNKCSFCCKNDRLNGRDECFFYKVIGANGCFSEQNRVLRLALCNNQEMVK